MGHARSSVEWVCRRCSVRSAQARLLRPVYEGGEGDVIEGITDQYAWYRKREQIRQHTYEDDQEL